MKMKLTTEICVFSHPFGQVTLQIADRKKIETYELQIKIKTCKLQACNNSLTNFESEIITEAQNVQAEDKTSGCLLKENI